jgi:hypothetical protein
MLPREVTFQAAACLGIHPQILTRGAQLLLAFRDISLLEVDSLLSKLDHAQAPLKAAAL